MEDLPADKAKNGRPSAYDDEIAGKIIDAVRSGLTLERAAEYVGLNPSTVQNWTTKRPTFGRAVKKARRDHEISLLRSIELAGEKSWQARAWLAERVHGYAQPSARLQVSGSVDHNAGAGFAQLIAGLASKRAEKKAQVIEAEEVRAIEDAKKASSRINEGTSYNTSYATLATNPSDHKPLTINNNKNHAKLSEVTSPKLRNKPMRRRKPRIESLAKYPPPTTTPPADPPAAI